MYILGLKSLNKIIIVNYFYIISFEKSNLLILGPVLHLVLGVTNLVGRVGVEDG